MNMTRLALVLLAAVAATATAADAPQALSSTKDRGVVSIVDRPTLMLEA